MINAPKVARPSILADMTAEQRAQVVDEVRFAEFSSSLENQAVQSLSKIRTNTHDAARALATFSGDVAGLQRSVRMMTTATELLLLAQAGYDVSNVRDVELMALRYGVTQRESSIKTTKGSSE